MKIKLLLFFIWASVFTACSKNETAPVVIDNPPPIDTSTSVLKYMGTFQSGPYGTTSGMARLYLSNGKWILRLEGFSVSSGPDLKVYLAKDVPPLNFLRLGSLKANVGDQEYEVPGNPDPDQYKYAVIHCEKYNHLFGSALLIKL